MNKIEISRSTAAALLVRLELVDIPYVQSSQERDDLSKYLCAILSDNIDKFYEPVLCIDIDDLKQHILNYDSAINILKRYAISLY